MSGARGRPGDTKATGDSKHQLGMIITHKWLLYIVIQGALRTEERLQYITYDIVVSNCLFMVD